MVFKREVMALSHYCNEILNRAHKHFREDIPINVPSVMESKSLTNLINSIETAYGIPRWKEFREDYEVKNEEIIHAYDMLMKECRFFGYDPSEPNSSIVKIVN
ncbi:hypothetical protein HY449_04095 [Candidatus Pacearchaeota archaeon]|nr:hypothetical protein [Candidatus Pacearchaeota archaeon]